MHIHILGACGTFMGGLAVLAKQAGHRVSGSDQHTYPPMSTQLIEQGIDLKEGYHTEDLEPNPDLVIIGNALSRGNEAVEYVLNESIPYCSGPRWLGENYLKGKFVVAVAGTHGKTSTSSMVAWILEYAGLNPGFLIGGVPHNFGISARDGENFFVVEADEYDTAFFDKRAKFVHYRPRVAILNNLEFDHVDIYNDLAAIKTQFHHLVRTIPGQGIIVSNGEDQNLADVLEDGCWSELQMFAQDGDPQWRVSALKSDCTELEFWFRGKSLGSLKWDQSGEHNAMNACAAIAAAAGAGVLPATGIEALAQFKGVSRRLECISDTNDISVYDDFAHHPTAVRLTLDGLRKKVGNARILLALEPRSNTMRAGVHLAELAPALAAADMVWLMADNNIDWDPFEVIGKLDGRGRVTNKVSRLLEEMLEQAAPGDHVVFMSNGGFRAAPRRFADGLDERERI